MEKRGLLQQYKAEIGNHFRDPPGGPRPVLTMICVPCLLLWRGCSSGYLVIQTND